MTAPATLPIPRRYRLCPGCARAIIGSRETCAACRRQELSRLGAVAWMILASVRLAMRLG